ncbi:phage tail tape measure protein [Limosilactobacillus mucosae]|uniref:phage tail tape measure protein n=1 Tax=Limosilactobacillus mucosae TaxID=97478 RepID=UPI00233E8A67|nr:phage tail tape measure protein [Limosilactobacillus mucosae]MDC2841910.1 phage tail tape measure protein [Limosilactobacillus mucosae]
MGESYSVKAILSAVDTSFSSTIARAGQATESFGQAVNRHMQGVGNAMIAAGTATTAMGVKAVKGFGSFQSSLNQAAVIAGGTAKDIDGLSDVANHMGAVLPISAQDAADAMVAMARDGASIGTIKKEFPAIAEAATAAGANLQTTASVVQQAMNIWGDSLKSPQQAAAILTQTANLSNASIEDMQQALATIGSVAKLAGMDMSTTSEAIGLLTNRGFSAAQASEDLSYAIRQMLAPSKGAKKEMDALGLSFVDSSGKMKPFPQILKEVAAATDGMGDAQKTAALKTMFGAAGMQAIAPLLDAVKDKSDNTTTSWTAYANAMNGAAKDTQTATKFLSDQANEMQKNLGSKIEQVGGNWEALRNKAMQTKGGVNSAILDMMNQSLEWATTSDSSTAQVIRSFIGMSPAIGAATTALGGLFKGWGKLISFGGSVIKTIGNAGRVMKALSMAGDLTTAIGSLRELAATSQLAAGAMRVLQVAQLALANPWVAIGVAIAAVVAALAVFFTKTKTGQAMWKQFTQSVADSVDGIKQAWQSMTDFFSNLWDGIVTTAQNIWSSFGQFFSPVVQSVESIWQGLSDFFGNLWNGIVTFAQGVWSSFAQGMAPIVDAFKNLWSALTDFFSTLWQGIVNTAQTIWQGLLPIVTTVWNGIKTVVSTIMQAIADVIQTIGTAIQTVWTTIWNAIETVAMTIWDAIKNFISLEIQGIQTVIQSVMTIIQTIWQTAWNVIETTVQTVWSIISTIVSTAINAVAGVIRAVTDAIKGDWSGAWNEIENVASTIWNGITSVVSTAINGVRNVISSVMNGIKSVWSSVWNGIKSVTSGAMSMVRSVVSSGMSAMRGVVSSMMSAVQSAFVSGWNAARNATANGISRAVSAARSMTGAMVSAGRDFVMGFVNGIEGAIWRAASAAARMASAAMHAAKAWFNIGSPSKVMRDQVGKWVPAGLAVGIEQNTDLVENAAKRMAEAAMPDIHMTDMQQRINGALSHGASFGGTIDHELNVVQQPAYINLSLGGSNYTTFVSDISREQGSQASLARNYRF